MTNYVTKTIVSIPAWAETTQNAERINAAAETYARVPLVYRALRLRCNSLLQIPYHIYKGDTETEWMFPVDLDMLLWKTQASILLAGSAYWLKQRNRVRVLDLQWLNPFTVRVEWNAQREQREFFQYVGGKRYPQVGMWADEDIVFFREFNIANDVGVGVAAADVALTSAKLAFSIEQMAANFFENGAMPVTVLGVAGLTDKTERERVQGFFKRAMQGIRNAYRVLALSQDIKLETVQSPLGELAAPELSEQARKDVARAFELPVTLLDSDETFATASVHARQYYNDTVIPSAKLIASTINSSLFADTGYRIEFAPNEMDIFQEDEAQRASALSTLVTTINSAASNPDALRAAMQLLGYDIPQDVEALLFKAQANVAQANVAQASAQATESMEMAKRVEREQFKNFARKRKADTLHTFQFKYLSADEQATLLSEAHTSSDMLGAFFREHQKRRGGSTPILRAATQIDS